MLQNAAPNLKRLAGAHAAASAHHMRAQAMDNMSSMGIGLVTGRSRALYGVRVEPAAYDPRASGSVAAYSGYLDWPDDVVFYPRFLNDGTSLMRARPYHDLAFEQTAPFFEQGMKRALERALQGAT